MTRLIIWSIVGALFIGAVTLILAYSDPLQYYRDQVADSVDKIRLEAHYVNDQRQAAIQAQQWRAAFEAGKQRRQLEQWELAIQHFDQAIRIKKHWHEAHCLKTDCLYQLERYEEAVEASRSALMTSAKCEATLVTRGMALERLDRYEEAISAYQLGLKRDPESITFHINLGWLYAGCPDESRTDGELALQCAEEAKRLLEVCTDCTPKHEWVVASLRGAAYARNGRFAEAIEFTNRAIELAPANEHARLTQNIRDFENEIPYVRRVDKAVKTERSSENDESPAKLPS